MMMTGPGERGEAVANHIANDNSMAEDPRQPGEGPDKDERENGMYDVLFVGQADNGDLVKVSVQGDKDPGYGSTSKMIAESACLPADEPAGCQRRNLDPSAGHGNFVNRTFTGQCGPNIYC